MNTSRIIIGNCIDSLKNIESCHVQTCITSPPYYGLRDYGVEGQIGLEQSPDEYVKNLVEVFREVKRVLRGDGTLWLNLGDSYYNYRPGKGQGIVKQTVSNTKQDLPDTCARRANKLSGLKEKDLIGIPWRVAFALQADGWYLRQDIIWHKPNPMPESVRDRCTKAHEYIFLFSKSPKYYFDHDAIKEPSKYPNDNRKSKQSLETYQNMCGDTGQIRAVINPKNPKTYPVRNKRSVWTVNTKPYKGAHFATFPIDLIDPCVLAGSKPDDIILDPFAGSGTVGESALKHGRKSILCELNPEYEKLIINRIGLFG